jgi:protein-S-isoprenylcysteine O-methyltransferase Ste14
MKINTSASVIVRIVLWLGLIFGGIGWSISRDIADHETLFYNPLFHFATFIVGIVLMRFAFRAAAAGGKELAKSGRDRDLPRLETNKLVVSGIYSYMRHPMLFGLLLIPFSVALLVGSPTFILFVAPLEMLFIAFMVLVFEEMECKKKFGSEYEVYSQKVPMVCIRRDCLKKLFF